MNQERIGKFISECRKNKNLTQEHLAELLGVSNRTISKWETGKCLPDYSVLPLLCKILNITINDLFSGEKVDNNDYQTRLEENIILNMELLKKNTKKLINNILKVFIGIFVLIALLVMFFLLYLGLSQRKIYLSSNDINYNICQYDNKIQFELNSKNNQPILIDIKNDNKNNFIKAYSYQNKKYMENYSNGATYTFNSDVESIYINDKIVYKRGLLLDNCFNQ